MSADRVTVAIGEPFHLTISAHVDESVPQLDNLTLPDLSGFDSLGDERRCVSASGAGTDCVETVTLAATIAGKRTIAGATLDAIDGRNGKPSRFTTDPVSILVTGPIPAPIGDAPSNLTALLFSFAKSATIFMLVVVAVLALMWAFFSKRAVVVAPQPMPAPVPPPDPRGRFRELIDALVREPTRFNALRLREAMREAMHARDGETLADLDARAAGTPDDRLALRAVEKAAFCEDARVADAVREATPFLIR
jgi:hypothetical protein